MRLSTLFALLALSYCAIAGPSTAQNFNQWSFRSLYVSTTGVDNPFDPTVTPTPGTIAAPFRTITFALSEVSRLNNTVGLTPISTSINVFAGTYDAVGGELFPLQVPMHGVKLEAIEPGVTIVGDPMSSVITVSLATPIFLLPSIIRGLEITGGSVGVSVIATNPIPLGADLDLLRPEIRNCNIHDNLGTTGFAGVGIRVSNSSELRTEVVIEDNEIHDHGIINEFFAIPNAGIEVFTGLGSADSSLIRGNKIYHQEVGISADGRFGICRPRVFSNFLWHHEIHVFSTDSGTLVINNTLAFNMAFSAFPVLRGVLHSGAGAAQNEVMGAGLQMNPMKNLLVVRNNILWNPSIGAFQAPEISGNGPFCIGFNDMEDAGTATNVFNRGGNVVIATVPPFVLAPTDLRLLPTAPQIETAEAAFIVPGFVINLDGNLPFVRVDITVDNEGDSRILEFNKVDDGVLPDRGGDEVRAPGNVNLSTTNIDDFGNVRVARIATVPIDWSFTLTITKRPNEFAALLGWQTDPSGPVDMNYTNTFLSPWGNSLLPTASMVTLLSSLSPGTTETFAPAPVAYNPLFVDCELYFQAITIDLLTGKGDVTNRVRVEFNE